MLVSPCIIDLSGNNSFYFTTNVATGNYYFVTLSGESGRNIFRKNTTNKRWYRHQILQKY